MGNAQLEAPSIMHRVEASMEHSQAPDVAGFQPALQGGRGAPTGVPLRGPSLDREQVWDAEREGKPQA